MKFISIILSTGLLCGCVSSETANERESRQNSFLDGNTNFIMLDDKTNGLAGNSFSSFINPGATSDGGPLAQFVPMGIDGPLGILPFTGTGESGSIFPDAALSNSFGNTFSNSGLSGNPLQSVNSFNNPIQNTNPFNNPIQSSIGFSGNQLGNSGIFGAGNSGMFGAGNSGSPGAGNTGQFPGILPNSGLSNTLLGGLPGPGFSGFGGPNSLNRFPGFQGSGAGGGFPNIGSLPQNSAFQGTSGIPTSNGFFGGNGLPSRNRLPGITGSNVFPGFNQPAAGAFGGLGALQTAGRPNGGMRSMPTPGDSGSNMLLSGRLNPLSSGGSSRSASKD